MATISKLIQDNDIKISGLQAEMDCASVLIQQLRAELAIAHQINAELLQHTFNLAPEPIVFSKWGGPGGIEEYIKQETGCTPFAAAGINPRPAKALTILRSVHGTQFYADDLSDVNRPKYTLFGHDGDQDEHEKQFNEPLLNPIKTKDIYLYEVRNNGKKQEYLWYGKYVIDEKIKKQHPGKDGTLRTIIVLTLKRL
jgi:hypothetical protein